MNFHVPSIRPILVTLCLILIVHKGFSQKAFRVKFQDWIEDDDRIRVRSWYAEAETPLNSNWDIGIVGMVDSISGATPMGKPPTANKSDWLAYLEEERREGEETQCRKNELSLSRRTSSAEIDNSSFLGQLESDKVLFE